MGALTTALILRWVRFWGEPPSDEDRAQSVESAGGDLNPLYPFDPDENSCQDDFMIGRAAAD